MLTGQQANELVQKYGKTIVDEGNSIQEKTGQRWNERDWTNFRISRASNTRQDVKINEGQIKKAPSQYTNEKEWEIAKRIDKVTRLDTSESRMATAQQEAKSEQDKIDEKIRAIEEREKQQLQELGLA